jgi:hypothetical protein
VAFKTVGDPLVIPLKPARLFLPLVKERRETFHGISSQPIGMPRTGERSPHVEPFRAEDLRRKPSRTINLLGWLDSVAKLPTI